MADQGKRYLGAGTAAVGDILQADPDKSTAPKKADFTRPPVNGYYMGIDDVAYLTAMQKWKDAQPVRYIRVRKVELKEYTFDGETTSSATAIGPYVSGEEAKKGFAEQKARLDAEPRKYDVYG